MSHFEDDPANPGAASAEPAAEPLAPVACSTPALPPPAPSVPEDLRISWSWPHFIVFFLFGFGSLIIVQLAFATYLSSFRHIPIKEVERLLTTKAHFAVAIQLVWFALLLLFLYVTLGVLRDTPFWPSVGWRAFPGGGLPFKSRAWRYFMFGCGLALVIAGVGYRFQPKEKPPIEELFKDPRGALLLMALAVFVAPLVEETLFRGYLYPLFARKLGVPAGILLTGLLFGLMHGSQLGWTWGLVVPLILVGVVFTYVRARAGTVLASYLLHLGYNSMIAVSVAVATRGFQQIPSGP